MSVNVSAGLDAHEDGDGGARLFVSGYDLPTGEDPTQVTIEVVECDAASPTTWRSAPRVAGRRREVRRQLSHGAEEAP